MSDILLGYEIGSGKPVRIPFAHTVVCGQTQASGKTTTLEGLLSRAGDPLWPALAFVTKQSESAFVDAPRIPPYFRDRADWRFVESILEAMMQEEMKKQRPWIMRVCEGAHTLEQVAANVERELSGGKKKKAATGYAAGMYLQLSEYFKIILPELRRLRVDMGSSDLCLASGLNVMDLSEYSTEMQSLAIASSMDRVYKMRNPAIVTTPEAWEFVPEGMNSPVKVSAISLVRKGLGGGKLMWFDSQDITGVDKKLLKQCAVWILGVQREINEVKKTLAQVPLPNSAKPKPEDVMHLNRGEFFACFGKEVHRVYVQPKWMSGSNALNIAMGMYRAEDFAAPARKTKAVKEHENMDYKAAWEEAMQTIRSLELRIKQLEKGADAPRPDSPPAPRLEVAFNEPGSSNGEVAMSLEVKRPVIDVTVRKYVIEADDSTMAGRLALLVSESFFDNSKRLQDVGAEFRARAWMEVKAPNGVLVKSITPLCEMGFLRIVGQLTYQSVPGMKVNVKEVSAVA